MARLDLVVHSVVEGANNIKGLAGDLSQAEGEAKKMDTSFKGLLKTGAALGAGFLGAQAVAQTVEFIADAVNAAAEFEDTVSATSVIFTEEATPAMQDWADSAASAFGASKQLALGAANQMGVFAKSAGLAGEDAAAFAQQMTQLGGDLASFFGGSTEEAITAIGAALRGESEPIRRYGILLDDATLRQRALKLGLISTTKQGLTPQIRVLAAQAEILAQSSDAQGDFARTSEGMANTQREIAAEFENLTIEIGQQLMPVFLELAHFVRDVVIPTFSFLGNSIDVVSGIINQLVNPFGAQVDAQRKAAAETDKLIEHQADQWESYSQTISDASFSVEEAAELIADIPRAEIEARWDDVRAAAFQMVVQQKLGILDAQNEVKVAFEVLTRLQEEEQTKAQRIAYLQGQLNSQQLANGLNDEREGVRSTAEAIRGDIIAELASLGVDAYNSGLSVPANVAAGIQANAHLVDGATSALAAKISGYLPRSNAKVGPLSDIMDVGGAIVSSISTQMTRSLWLAERASAALAGTLAQSPLFPGSPSLSGAADAALPAGVQVNLTVQGDLKADERSLPSILQRSLFASGVLENAAG